MLHCPWGTGKGKHPMGTSILENEEWQPQEEVFPAKGWSQQKPRAQKPPAPSTLPQGAHCHLWQTSPKLQ